LAERVLLDARRVDDGGLREVALVPVERARRDRDAVPRADAAVTVHPRADHPGNAAIAATAPLRGARTPSPRRATTRPSSGTCPEPGVGGGTDPGPAARRSGPS